MNDDILTSSLIKKFEQNLTESEKSRATVEKYLRDVTAFGAFAQGEPISKELAVAYKEHLSNRGYAVRSINSMLASVNSLFRFLGRPDCAVKNLRTQRQAYCPEETVLTKKEYLRLLSTAQKSPRLYYLLQTICSTGIRVSELSWFTVEAVRRGEVTVSCKGKVRRILLPGKLRKMLLSYAREAKIREGVIFRTRGGKPLHRANIWREMKNLCAKAGVSAAKVFPHNLRKLFARTFYSQGRDIAKLADVLGHSSINTTRIYLMTEGEEHRRRIDQLGLVIFPQKEKTT